MHERRLTGFLDAGDRARCTDQSQAHSPHVLELLFLQAQEPSLYLEDNHFHTCLITR